MEGHSGEGNSSVWQEGSSAVSMDDNESITQLLQQQGTTSPLGPIEGRAGTNDLRDQMSFDVKSLREELRQTQRKQSELETKVERMDQEMQELKSQRSQDMEQAADVGQALRNPGSVYEGALPAVADKEEKTDEVGHGLSVVTHFKTCASHYQRPFQESMWEAPLLIGLDASKRLTSLWLLSGFLVNLWVQSILVYIIVTSTDFMRPSLVSVEYAKIFRETVAHDVKFADSLTQHSLASRVCGRDASLSMGVSLRDTVVTVESYLESFYGFRDDDEDAPIRSALMTFKGVVLCLVIVFIWFLSVVEEIKTTYGFMCALLGVVDFKSRKTKLAHNVDGNFVLVKLGAPKFAALCVISLLRLAVAVCLLLAGTQWLCLTHVLENLVLNGVALAFVMDLDELMFQSYVPNHSKAIMERMEPLATDKIYSHFWLHVFGFLASVFTVLYLMLVIFFYLQPEVDMMHSLHQELCGGTVELLYSTGNSFGTFYVTVGPRFGDLNENLFAREAVREMILVNEPPQTAEDFEVNGRLTLSQYRTRDTFNSISLQSTAEWVEDFYCVDKDLAGQGDRLILLQQLTDTPNVTSCQDLAKHCTRHDLDLLRLMCPVTCGCATFRSGLYHGGPASGCNRDSCRQLESYMKSHQGVNCSDPTPEELQNMRGWQEYWRQRAETQGQQQQGKGSTLVTKAMKDGCSFKAKKTPWKYCNENQQYNGIREFCPVRCKYLPTSCLHSNQTMS